MMYNFNLMNYIYRKLHR